MHRTCHWTSSFPQSLLSLYPVSFVRSRDAVIYAQMRAGHEINVEGSRNLSRALGVVFYCLSIL